MPAYKCPLTGQTGHLHVGRMSFYEWARKYFGEFHTYEDDELVPVPCHRIFVQSGKPKTHSEFIGWCVSQGQTNWLPKHIASGKVAGVQKVCDKAKLKGRRTKKRMVPQTKVSAIKSRISEKDFLQVEANLKSIRKKNEKNKAVLTKKRRASAKKATATRKKKKAQIDADAKKRSDSAKKAWATRRKNQRA